MALPPRQHGANKRSATPAHPLTHTSQPSYTIRSSSIHNLFPRHKQFASIYMGMNLEKASHSHEPPTWPPDCHRMKHHNHYIINYNQIILSVDKINKNIMLSPIRTDQTDGDTVSWQASPPSMRPPSASGPAERSTLATH